MLLKHIIKPAENVSERMNRWCMKLFVKDRGIVYESKYISLALMIFNGSILL